MSAAPDMHIAPDARPPRQQAVVGGRVSDDRFHFAFGALDGGADMSGLRIAQVSPLTERVPPRQYGGTERVVSYLTEELVGQGHDVTLFASGNSVTRARLVSSCPHEIRGDPAKPDPLACEVLLLERVLSQASRFDIIHFHTQLLHLPMMRRMRTPAVTTLHGRLDVPAIGGVFREYGEAPLVSVSDAQRKPLSTQNWAGTVHHGLPKELLHFTPDSAGYLAFLGRVSPEKGVERAIEIARRAGIPLRIAAKVDNADKGYYERAIAPILDSPGVEFLGEIDEREKDRFLGNALALLFPIDWPEPFGLVLIEAMACGTPAVAFRRGAVEEIVTHGVTGCIVDDVEGGVRAVKEIGGLDRRSCRVEFERRFTAERMAADYVKLYRNVIYGRAAAS